MNWMNSILRRLSLTNHPNCIEGGELARRRRAQRARVRSRPLALELLEDRFVLAASTTLAVSAAMGTYGGTATVTANLSSTGIPVAGESVDLMLGATDLGLVVTDVNGNATIPAASLAFINAGTYIGDVTASFAGDASFNPSSGSNDLTINPAALTITADNQTKVYGASLPAFTASYTGFVNGDTSASLTTVPTLTTTATAASHVAGSPYSITAGGAVDSNYAISYVAGSLSVTTAPLTITANNQTKVYGAALPTLTASYTGFVNGDTAASLSTAPTLTTAATSASHVAGSPFSITASGAVDSDYAISYVNGSLSITAAPLTITANNQTTVYGAALPTLTASYTGFVNGDTAASLSAAATLTTTATSVSPVGAYATTASGAVDSDYAISYVAGSLTVTAAAPTPVPTPTPTPTPVPTPVPTAAPVLVATSPNSGPNGTEIKVFDPATGRNTRTLVPFAGFNGAVDVASGDLNNDGIADVAVGAGVGGGPRVRVFDGATGAVLADFFAFGEQFTGGVDVAIGDVHGDGTPDLIVAAGPGGGPHVKVFDGKSFAELFSFFAYAPNFTGGVNVAAGDVNGDGKADIITGAGMGAGPHVKVFDGANLAELYSYFAFDPAFGGGVRVAAGDVNGDGFADVVAGAGIGGSPQVAVFDGKTGANRGSFPAFDAGFRGGVNVGTTVGRDGRADIVAAAGPGGGPSVRVFDGQSFDLLSSTYAFADGLLGGVSVG